MKKLLLLIVLPYMALFIPEYSKAQTYISSVGIYDASYGSNPCGLGIGATGVPYNKYFSININGVDMFDGNLNQANGVTITYYSLPGHVGVDVLKCVMEAAGGGSLIAGDVKTIKIKVWDRDVLGNYTLADTGDDYIYTVPASYVCLQPPCPTDSTITPVPVTTAAVDDCMCGANNRKYEICFKGQSLCVNKIHYDLYKSRGAVDCNCE